jgi:hypothetical protein
VTKGLSETNEAATARSRATRANSKMDEQTARRDLIKICHLMYERSYVVSS